MCVCVERMDFNRHSNTCDLKVPGEVTVPFEVRFFFGFFKKNFFCDVQIFINTTVNKYAFQ